MQGHSEKVSFIWSVADLLRGDYKASDYGKVILPFVVLRRLDCLLEAAKPAVLTQLAKIPASADSTMREMLLNRAAGHSFHNASRFTFDLLKADAAGQNRTRAASVRFGRVPIVVRDFKKKRQELASGDGATTGIVPAGPPRSLRRRSYEGADALPMPMRLMPSGRPCTKGKVTKLVR